MVLNCVAYRCNNLYDKMSKIPFHRFPFKRPEILHLWVKAIRREAWSPSRTSRLCGAHFLPSDYIEKPGSSVKILKLDAVPSVFSFPKHLQNKPTLPRRKILKQDDKCQFQAEPMDIVDSPSTSEMPPKFIDIGVQTNNVNTKEKIVSLHRKVKTLKQKVKRRDIKISNMEQLISEIKNSGHSNESLNTVLEKYFEGFPLELVLLQKNKMEESHPGQRRYSSLMKQFSHTLYFYSPKAYNFLRKHFTLPNGRTIRKWLSTLNCEPGVLGEVLDFLKKHVLENVSLKNCAMIFDSMAIRNETVWDNEQGKYTGNINYGKIVDVDFEMAATEALFFQIVGYKNPFKCPVAYFLVNKIDANLQSHIINSILRSLYEIGINIRSLTSDGASANILTYEKLGCKMDIENLVEFFHHPCDVNIKVYCMLDTCHMVKLARNTLAEKQIESSKGKIDWLYVRELDMVQKSEQLSLANSLTSQHVNFKNKIMNVKLAAQTLSSGVADAIEYLDKVCNLNAFNNSVATVEFIRKIDRIFDILNCRNPFGKGFKAPIRPATLNYFEEVFSDAIIYLKSLKIEGIPLTRHMRKTFAVGFILTMKSTFGLAKDLFSLIENPLQYFLSYKCSQDHLEIYFSCIRSRGGWNNNPNNRQLKWALRQLLFSRSISSSVNANCINFENYCTPVFEFRSQNRQKKDASIDSTYDEAVGSYVSLLGNTSLTHFQENVIFYIAGFVVRNLIKRTSCDDCINILMYKEADSGLLDHGYSASSDTSHIFTNFITRGGLVYSSRIIYDIIKFSEKQFRIFLEKDNIFTTKLNIKKLLTNTALHHFAANIRNFKPTHPIVQDISEEPHELQIVRKTIEIFLKCRMHHHSKLINLRVHGNEATVRQKMNKLILFKNC